MLSSPFLWGIFLILYLVVKSKWSSKKSFLIQYDCRDKKSFFLLAMVFSVCTIIFIGISRFPIFKKADDIITIIIILGIPFFFLAAFISWIIYVDAVFYLQRLKKYGYQLPNDKKEFSRQLENLPKVTVEQNRNIELSYESMILAVISMAITIGILVNIGCFFFQYRQTGLEWIGFWGELPLVLYWLLRTVFWWKQRLYSKYRDDVEIDETRKQRKHLISGLISILVWSAITIVWIEALYNGADYMHRARIEAGYYK